MLLQLTSHHNLQVPGSRVNLTKNYWFLHNVENKNYSTAITEVGERDTYCQPDPILRCIKFTNLSYSSL